MKNTIFTSLLCLFICSVAFSQSQNWMWAKSAGGKGNDIAQCTTTDVAGNVYVTGSFASHTINFGSIALTNTDAYGVSNIFIAKYNQAGVILWAKNAKGAASGQGVATDASGNVYVTGYYSGPTLRFGNTEITNSGTGNIFVVKYNRFGHVLWAKSAGGSSFDLANSIATDPEGNFFITGYFFSPSVSFGNTTLTNTGRGDVFIAKFDSSGNALWAKSAVGNSFDYGFSVATDYLGNAIVSGYFDSPELTFGDITLVNSVATGWVEDAYIAKYDASGNVLWAKSAGGLDRDYGQGVTTDAAGNIFFTGDYDSHFISFGNMKLENASTLHNSNIFLIKYDPSGNVRWAKTFGGNNGSDVGESVATNASGNVYLTGLFISSTITFGNTTLTNTGGGDVFIAKFTPSGDAVWAKSARGNNGDGGSSVAADNMGNVYVTGIFWSRSIGFDGIRLKNSDSMGFVTPDIFLGKIGMTNTSELATLNSKVTQNYFSLFPNPSQGNVNILSTNNIDEIKIADVIGRIIYKAKPDSRKVSVHLDKEGIYFISITYNQQTFTQLATVVR